MNTVHVNVCIAGGGPAGMMLGLLLARRGASVIVLEGHENFDREYRGEVLQPSTAHLLDEIGLLSYILEQPHSLLRNGRVRFNGKEMGGFSFKRIAPEYPYAIWMPQPIFLAALLRKAEALPSFQCWMGARVTSLIQENGKYAGVTGIRHGKEPFEVRADVVIGADGRYSAIARMGGFKPVYEHHDFDLIWFTIDKPAGWDDTIHVSLGDEVGGLMLPKYPHHVQVGLGLPTGEWKRWRQEGVSTVAARIRRFDPMFEEFAAGLRDFTPFVPLEGIVRLVDDWARDGLLLIGDAAHTMSPAGAIGVNVAIATAVVAAQEIYPRLGRGPIAHADLRRIQEQREPDVRALHRLQIASQTILLAQNRRSPMMQWLLPKLLPIVLHSPIMPAIQRRIFFGAPLPPIDPAFSFASGFVTPPAEAAPMSAAAGGGGSR